MFGPQFRGYPEVNLQKDVENPLKKKTHEHDLHSGWVNFTSNYLQGTRLNSGICGHITGKTWYYTPMLIHPNTHTICKVNVEIFREDVLGYNENDVTIASGNFTLCNGKHHFE